jgi:hypothetical protein
LKDDKIAALLEAARRKSKTVDELPQQRASFAHGNANLERDTFSRATVTMMILPDAASTASELVQSEHRRDVEAIVRQYDLAVELIQNYTAPVSPRFVLTSGLVVELQATLAYPGGPQSGYRSFPVRIATNDFAPIPPGEVPQAVEELCNYVNRNWDAADPIELAAYVLWRVNWIHPFIDGNGRTARALSYIIMCIKLGFLLPGTPTIPEQLLERRGDYYDALAKADEAFRQGGDIDVAPLRDLLNAMLVRQLGMVPALSLKDIETIREAVEQRVHTSSADVAAKAFGTEPIDIRLWLLDDYLVLQVGSHTAISEAEARQTEDGSPFPRLLARRDQTGSLRIAENEHGLILRDRTLDASSGYALQLERNAAITIERPHVKWKGEEFAGSWRLEGSLYVIRLGRWIPLTRARSMFDVLLARHIASIHS